MSIVTMRYFKDHASGSPFDNQRALADRLETLGQRDILESNHVNPLTVRMCSAKRALDTIHQYHIKIAPRPFPVPVVNHYQYYGVQPSMEWVATTAPSGSMQSYASWAVPKTHLQISGHQAPNGYQVYSDFDHSNRWRIVDLSGPAHEFEFHTSLYDFFANIESLLDRARLELNSVYFDGSKVLTRSKGNKYWSKYLDGTERCTRALSVSGFTHMAALLTDPTNSIGLYDRISRYRNRVIHDGIITIRFDYPNQRSFLPDTPNTPSSPCNVELMPYLGLIFDDLQRLMRSLYAQMLTDLQGRTALPLIP